MKRIGQIVLVLLLVLAFPLQARAAMGTEGFDVREQLDALGRDELMQQVPAEARALMEESDVYDLSVDKLLQLSPRHFFATLWQMAVHRIKQPLRTLGHIAAILVLCALMDAMKTAGWDGSLSQVFTTVCVLCVIGSMVVPILDCIVKTSQVVQDASLFMLSFIPMFSAALAAAGQPIAGATYNMFLFSTCQLASQVVAQTLIPLMGVYLALCLVGGAVPQMNIASATKAVKSVVTWALGLILTVFVGLLSVQTMVAQGADSVTTRTAKFLIGSFVPVVGGALSEAFNAAQGCLQLIKTSVGAYGVVVAVFTFLPVLLQTVVWYLLANVAAIGGDLIGVPGVAGVLRACASVLGILTAVILCFALLIIVSTTVVMVTGMGVG